MTEAPLPPDDNTRPVQAGNPLISPAVASLAYQNHIDLTRITGSGANGRITRQNVLNAIHSGKARLSAGRSPAACITLDIDLNRMSRSLKNWNEAQFGVIALEPIHGILAAALDSLEHFPRITTPVDDPQVHLVRPGVSPLILPKPLLEEPLPNLAARIQQSEEDTQEPALHDPAFIIEDHSQTGVTIAIPSLPAGQHALLAVARAKRRPVAVTNTIVIHLVANLSLVYDPEHVASAEAAEFLAFIKRQLKDW